MSATVSKFYDQDMRPPRGGWGCFIAGRTFECLSETDAFDQVKRWRGNNQTYTNDFDIWNELWAYWRGRQPDRQTKNFIPGDPRPVSSDGTRELSWQLGEGPELWRALHLDAAVHVREGAVDPATQMGFLASFRNAIRCPECRINWNGEVASMPPVFSSPDNYFAWTVAIHNRVNDRLGKAQFSLEAARELYGL
jgi:hypothetical protein